MLTSTIHRIRRKKVYLIGLFLTTSVLATPFCIDRKWTEETIYFALIDRFYDGDSSNNRPIGSDAKLYDAKQENINLYHGGDLRGLEIALESNYFTDLGITAIWITPPVRNVWYSAFDSGDEPKTGYHGYWTQDFLDIDPHLVSRKSLDGNKDYPDNREGRMEHYKDFVSLAHAKGIKIIQDIVCNHTGPVFYYDVNNNNRFDIQNKSEWIQPFSKKHSYVNAQWGNKPDWNLRPTMPSETLKIGGQEVSINGCLGQFTSYSCKGFSEDSLGKSDGEEVYCDFFALRNLRTDPDSNHFDKLVDDFVEIYAFYIETIGVDGLRIDTVKHVQGEFWDAFTDRLRSKLGPERSEKLILFGEVYDGDPKNIGKYTYRKDWPINKDPSLDSLLNFQFCYAIRSYLRTDDNSFGTAHEIERTINSLSSFPPENRERPYYNPTPGLDGIQANRKMISFFENHDGINRFRVSGVSVFRNILANALTLTLPGIPCIYYGTEAALIDDQANINQDAESGRMTFFKTSEPSLMNDVRTNSCFQMIACLNRLRSKLTSLTKGDTHILWVDNDLSDCDDGIFTFARTTHNETVLIVVNASSEIARTSIPGHVMPVVNSRGKPLLKLGDTLQRIEIGMAQSDNQNNYDNLIIWNSGIPLIEIKADAESIQIFKVIKGNRAK